MLEPDRPVEPVGPVGPVEPDRPGEPLLRMKSRRDFAMSSIGTWGSAPGLTERQSSVSRVTSLNLLGKNERNSE